MAFKSYDVAVIGGGAAGLTASIFAAVNGAQTILLEKNKILGKKLCLTGSGRCNITNSEKDLKQFADKFGKNGRFLYYPLNEFSPSDTVNFFRSIGINCYTEDSGKIFPLSNSAASVRNSLKEYSEQKGVKIVNECSVIDFVLDNNKILYVKTSKGDIYASNFIIATGGLSYPETGSSGDGYSWAENLGHKIIHPLPALTPIICRDSFIKDLEGLSLRQAKGSIYNNKLKLAESKGDAVFTKDGLSGPLIYDLSRKLRERGDDYSLMIDIMPEISYDELNQKLINIFQENNKKNIKNILDILLPQKIISFILNYASLSGEEKGATITKEQRMKVIKILKEMRLQIKSFCGFEKADITSGGVSLKEIDSKSMRSRLINNLYFAGEVIDLDGPTGGYNLQVCWSTGFIAGRSAAVS